MMKHKKKIKALRILRYRLLRYQLALPKRLVLASLPLLTHSRLTVPTLPRIDIILPRIDIILPRIDVISPRINVITRTNKKPATTALNPNHQLLPDAPLYKIKHGHYHIIHSKIINQHHHIRDRKLSAIYQNHAIYNDLIHNDSRQKHIAIKQYATHEYFSKQNSHQQNVTHENHQHVNKENMIKLIKNISAHDGGIKVAQHRLIQKIVPLATEAKQPQQAQSAVRANHAQSKTDRLKAENSSSQLDYGQIRQMMRDEIAQMSRQLQHVIQTETRNDFLETSRINARNIR